MRQIARKLSKKPQTDSSFVANRGDYFFLNPGVKGDVIPVDRVWYVRGDDYSERDFNPYRFDLSDSDYEESEHNEVSKSTVPGSVM